jgi:hypothetical protein
MTVVESPHVPTRPPSDNSNAAASTAYVTAAIAAIPAPPTIIPSGTAMVFYQASAPTGWTAVSLNDRALRVVSAGGSGGTGGGSNAFSTVFAQTATGSFTLSTNEMPSHSHGFTASVSSVQAGVVCGAIVSVGNTATGSNTGGAGSGGSHNHTITMSITYSDVIICTKN